MMWTFLDGTQLLATGELTPGSDQDLAAYLELELDTLDYLIIGAMPGRQVPFSRTNLTHLAHFARRYGAEGPPPPPERPALFPAPAGSLY